MKTNNRFIVAIVLVVVATLVSVVSCKKDNAKQTSNNTEQGLQNSDNMDEYLLAFKEKMLSAEKGGETITLEQAERDLGNLLNFDFGDANYATNVLHYDTVYSKLSSTNGQVDYSHLACTYQDLFSQVIDAYHQVNLPEKSVYAISCDFDANKKTKQLVLLLF